MEVLKKHSYRIESELTQESRAIRVLQPFVTELLQNEYATPVTIETIRSLVLLEDVSNFLKKQALLLTPSVNDLDIIEEAKIGMIDVAKKFSNYFKIVGLHSTLPKDKKLLRLVYSYDIDSSGILFLSEDATKRITDILTVYATPEEANIFNTLSECLTTIESIKSKTGFNLLKPGATRPTDSGGWEIHAETLLHTLRQRAA